MRKVKEDYENEIKALRARLLGCEAAVKRLAAAHNRWIYDGGTVSMTDEFDELNHRLDDLYHLARVDAPDPFEMVDEEEGEA